MKSAEDREIPEFAEFLSRSARRPVLATRLNNSSYLYLDLYVDGMRVARAWCVIDPPDDEEDEVDAPPSLGEWGPVLPGSPGHSNFIEAWRASGESAEKRLEETAAALGLDLKVADPPWFGQWTDSGWHQLALRATEGAPWLEQGEQLPQLTYEQIRWPDRTDGTVGGELDPFTAKPDPAVPHRGMPFKMFYSTGASGTGLVAWVGGTAVTEGLVSDLRVGLAGDHLRIRVTAPLVPSGHPRLPLVAMFEDFPIRPGVHDPQVFWQRPISASEVDVLESARIRFLLDGRLKAAGSGNLEVALAPIADTKRGALVTTPIVIAAGPRP